MRATTFVARSAKPALFLVLLFAAGLYGALPRTALAEPKAYTFTPLAFLGDPVPGGGNFFFDFEPGGVNNRGEVSFGADLTTGAEGVFLLRNGQLSTIARHGDPAPGGGTFGPAFLAATPPNDAGDVAFVFTLEPFSFPFGVNSGLYRFLHQTKTVEALVVPGVTPAPGGGVFVGVSFGASLNNRADIAFSAILPDADLALGPPGVDGLGLGKGVFVVDRRGEISSIARPGDPAPGGGTFDLATIPSINDRGDVAFAGHLAGEVCLAPGPQAVDILCSTNTYLKKASTNEILLIARQGGLAAGGGTCHGTIGRWLNNRGEIAFGCAMGPAADMFSLRGLFLFSGGETVPVARPGDPMPGGGNLVGAAGGNVFHLNNRGDVAFAAQLENVDEHGLYVWSRGSLRLVARTGTVIPGLGAIVGLLPPDLVGLGIDPFPIGANDRGQILFTATVDDGSGTPRGVLLLATPKG